MEFLPATSKSKQAGNRRLGLTSSQTRVELGIMRVALLLLGVCAVIVLTVPAQADQQADNAYRDGSAATRPTHTPTTGRRSSSSGTGDERQTMIGTEGRSAVSGGVSSRLAGASWPDGFGFAEFFTNGLYRLADSVEQISSAFEKIRKCYFRKA
jgi:hypothetical protein